jgi:hypothetical protein
MFVARCVFVPLLILGRAHCSPYRVQPIQEFDTAIFADYWDQTPLIHVAISQYQPKDMLVCLEGPDAESVQGLAATGRPSKAQVIAKARTLARPFVIYATHDAGSSWREVLRDSTHKWMSESSCAFGPDNTAYAAVSDSRVGEGGDHVDGGLRVYRSSDAGQTWGLVNRPLPFVDYTMVLVDGTSGRYRGRVYLFGNRIAVGNRARNSSGPDTWASWGSWAEEIRPLLTSTDEGRDFSVVFPRRPDFEPTCCGFPYFGAVLADGTAVAIYGETAKEIKVPVRNEPPHRNGTRLTYRRATGLSVNRTSDGGRTVERMERIPALQEVDELISGVGFAADTTSGAYGGRLYVTYQATSKGVPGMWLSTSNDIGRSWKTQRLPFTFEKDVVVRSDGRIDSRLALATNRDGVLGLIWGAINSTCLWFATSTNGGESWDKPAQVRPCGSTARRRTDPELQELLLNSAPDSTFRAVWWDNDAPGRSVIRGSTIRLTANENSSALAAGEEHLNGKAAVAVPVPRYH